LLSPGQGDGRNELDAMVNLSPTNTVAAVSSVLSGARFEVPGGVLFDPERMRRINEIITRTDWPRKVALGKLKRSLSQLESNSPESGRRWQFYALGLVLAAWDIEIGPLQYVCRT